MSSSLANHSDISHITKANNNKMSFIDITGGKSYYGISSIEDLSNDHLNNNVISSREIEVLSLIAEGFLTNEIADFLNISIATVSTHRKNILKNKDSLMYYGPYSQYIRNYLYNETYSLGHSPTKNEYSSKFTVDLLNTIDSKISSKRSKDAFLRQTVISHFYNKSSCNINEDAFKTYFNLSTNNKDKKLIQNLIDDTNAIHANKQLPNFIITDYTNSRQPISAITKNKNALLFFWNPEFVSESYLVSRVNYLSNKYPNIKFIQVKIDGDKSSRIQKLDIKNQFYIDKESSAHQFLTSKMPRSILIDKKGKVINGYASISSNNLNPFLKELNKN